MIQNSLQNQNILFISIEKYATVVLKALNKIKNNQIIAKNLFFICSDISKIPLEKFVKKI